jgi:uncharacterized protein (PEP-CTERM system associated)
MSSARPNLHSNLGIGAGRRWSLGPTLAFLLVASTAVIPAAAQTGEGGGPSAAGTAPAAGPLGTGGGAITPSVPGFVPETLPPPASSGFGFPNPAAPPYSVNNEIPTLTSPATLRLQPYAGVVPLQAYDPNAPAVVIRPSLSLGETFTDNVNYIHSPRNFAAITQLGGGLAASVDTPRLQAVATGQANGSIYLPSSNSTLNQIFGSLYANGHATVYPGLFFVDAQSSVTQSTTLPGFGFQNLSTLPRNQQTQQFITNVSPYLVKSFGGVADTQLRYTFNSTNYGGNTTVTSSPLVPGLNNLAGQTLNEGTFVAATGEDFQRAQLRFTADAAEVNSSSTAQSSQVSAYNDVQYLFTPTIAATGRAGYQNLRYANAPAATSAGPTWLAGGRLGIVGPDQPAYVALQYGRQQGVYGFTGSSQVNVTPSMLFTANAVQGIAAQGQLFANNLANSTLLPSGAIVDQSTGLPTAFFSPGLGLSNNVYRQHLFSAALSESLPPNYYTLYGSYTSQQSLTTTVGVPTKSVGLNFVYSRDIRPDLSGYATIGFLNSVNSPTVVPGTTTINFNERTNFSTANATVGINYLLASTLTGSILYTFSYQSTGRVVSGGRNGNVFANQLAFLLSKTF